MTAIEKTIDPVPPNAYPRLLPVKRAAPAMPYAWKATALLHPFSPPLSTDPRPDNPFFQLCVAEIICVPGAWLSAQVTGCDYGQWWYLLTPEGTQVSSDGGTSWHSADMGWSLPSNWFGAQAPDARCAGESPLNWMVKASVDWWKVPVPNTGGTPSATWFWFDASRSAPVRMMFGQGPPSPTHGDPGQLAFFQMWSFIYLPEFHAYRNRSVAPPRPVRFTPPSIQGFVAGNPRGYQSFTWSSNFGMTALMTPVNVQFNPLPTRVLYVWKPAADYKQYADRAQSTNMQYTYNGGNVKRQVALLTGHAPAGTVAPPASACGFLITYNITGSASCLSGSAFPFPQEPPNWIQLPGVQGTIRATITCNPVLAPSTTVTVFSALFPPALPNYPEATYLWTWYAPQDASGSHSRPIVFMQAQSEVNVGTSLALADYFYYKDFRLPIDPENFAIPSCCQAPS